VEIPRQHEPERETRQSSLRRQRALSTIDEGAIAPYVRLAASVRKGALGRECEGAGSRGTQCACKQEAEWP